MANKDITKPLMPPIDITQPMLLESAEFRRRADSDRSDTITKIERIEADISALEMQLAQLRARREDLLLIVAAVDQTLVIIPGVREGGVAAEVTQGADQE